jgi:pimeloyl-ACP methyl ester carboxylesterase
VTLRRASTALLLTEGPRAGLDLAALAALWPVLLAAPRGDGSPVLVLPGLLAGDPSTLLLRRALAALGHTVSGWGLGSNRGPTGSVVTALRTRLEELHRDSGGRTVTVVGWSLGGLYAQELARASPGKVRALVTLGTPRLARGKGTAHASRVADAVLGGRGMRQLPRPWAEAGSLRVPVTSVWSRSDGIIDGTTCRWGGGPRREDVEVRGAHAGLGHNPAVLWVLADRLAQPEGTWRPFVAPAVLRPLFPAG